MPRLHIRSAERLSGAIVLAATGLALTVVPLLGGETGLREWRPPAPSSGRAQAYGSDQGEQGPATASVDSTQIGPCVITHTRVFPSLEMDIGDRLPITTTIGATCRENRPLHLVFLVDASEQMSPSGVEALRNALINGVRALEPVPGGPVRIGVVSMGGSAGAGARIESYLTDDGERLVNTLRSLRSDGEASLTQGLTEAVIALRLAREGRAHEDLREVILLASTGVEQAGCEAVQNKAREARAQNILLITACAGAICERRCLAEAASAPRYAFRSAEWSAIGNLLTDLRDSTGPFHFLQGFQLFDSPRPPFSFVGSSDLIVDGRVEASMSPWPPGTVAVQYAALVDDCVSAPVSLRSEVTVRFSDGHGEVLPLDNPTVTVRCALPTPTARASSVPTGPPTNTATPRSEATRSPREELWLPVALRTGCLSPNGPVDVVLLLDVSGSMAVPFPGHATRWDAAKGAAGELIRQLAPGDRVAVLYYASEPHVLQALTTDHDVALRQLDRLPRLPGSRLDRALATTLAEVQSARIPGRPVNVVLMTDGDLNQTPREPLEAAVAAIKSASMALRVLLFGESSPDLWVEILGSRSAVQRYRAVAGMALLTGARCSR